MSKQNFNAAVSLSLDYSVNTENANRNKLKNASQIIRSELEEAMSKIEAKISDIEGVSYQK